MTLKIGRINRAARERWLIACLRIGATGVGRCGFEATPDCVDGLGDDMVAARSGHARGREAQTDPSQAKWQELQAGLHPDLQVFSASVLSLPNVLSRYFPVSRSFHRTRQ